MSATRKWNDKNVGILRMASKCGKEFDCNKEESKGEQGLAVSSKNVF